MKTFPCICIIVFLLSMSLNASVLNDSALSQIERYISTRDYELITVSGVLTYFSEKNVELPARDGGFWIFASSGHPVAIIRFNNNKPLFFGVDQHDTDADAIARLAKAFKIDLTDFHREAKKAVLIMGLPSKPVDMDESGLASFINRDLPMVLWYPDLDAVVYLPK